MSSDLDVVTIELVLVGPLAGKTKNLRGFQFTNGVCKLVGTMKSLEGPILYLGRCYQAYPRGSEQYKQALKLFGQSEPEEKTKQAAAPATQELPIVVIPATGAADDTTEDTENGERDPNPQTIDNAATTVPSGFRPPWEQSAAQAASNQSGNDNPASGQAASVPAGDGYEHARISQEQALRNKRVADALVMLDPKNDDHWTKNGIPTVSVVASLAELDDLTRKEIEEVAPGFTRDAASEEEE